MASKSRIWMAVAGLLLVVVAVAVFAFDRVRKAPGLQRGDVLAVVNDTPITVARFNESYVNYLITSGRNDTPENRHIHLRNLLDTYLLAEEAVRRGFDEDPDFQAYYDRKLRHTVGGQYFSEALVSTLPELTDTEIRIAFARSKESVIVRHLLFQDPDEAERAYQRLLEGEDFVQLANEVFQTAEFDSMAGYLGVAGYWELEDFFAEAAFEQPIGVPSKPVQTSYGYHIILKEDHLRSPLLTEDEYMFRRKGVSRRAHQRKRHIEGTRFIQELMSSLNVQVDAPAVQQLREAVQRLSVRADAISQQPSYKLSSAEVAALEERFTPETILLTYELDGEQRTFTAMDYYRWLEELPYREARDRTAASVGRALRNEVLAIRGFEAGLDRDETVTEYLRFASNAFLAGRLRGHLRTFERADPTEDEIEEAFERLQYRTLKRAVADFWTIPVESHRAGLEIIDKLESGAPPSSFAGFSYREREDLLRRDGLGGHVRRTFMNRPTVIGTNDGSWYVVEVDRRDVAWTTLEEKRDEIVERLATFMPEARLARDLFAAADVSVDSTMFREMMNRN